jgi:hypothetical protein
VPVRHATTIEPSLASASVKRNSYSSTSRVTFPRLPKPVTRCPLALSLMAAKSARNPSVQHGTRDDDVAVRIDRDAVDVVDALADTDEREAVVVEQRVDVAAVGIDARDREVVRAEHVLVPASNNLPAPSNVAANTAGNSCRAVLACAAHP